MFELTSLAVMTDEVSGLKRKGARRHGARKVSVCLVTLTNVLNDANILNIFGGGDGFSL
jgi:hypothetical protein